MYCAHVDIYTEINKRMKRITYGKTSGCFFTKGKITLLKSELIDFKSDSTNSLMSVPCSNSVRLVLEQRNQ